MKRLLTLALAATIVSSAFAQTSFTIRRPVDGSKVRETVAIRIPKNSLGDGSYIGLYIDDKFVEAAMPTEDGNDYVYMLDTKARRLTDGPHKIELVHFQEMGSGAPARLVDRTSVTLVVDNYSSIKVPEDGFDFRYKFVKGQELKYALTETQSISLISQALAQVGGHAAERTTDVEHARMMYAFDNVYDTKTGKEALIRIQALPDKGKDYAILTVSGETEPKRWYSHEMHPMYMRITDKGKEIMAGVPYYFPMMGSSGESFRNDLYLFLPPPVLPASTTRPNETFVGTYQLPSFSLDSMHDMKRLTRGEKTAGTFMGVEWYKGVPVAKLMYRQAFGAEDLKDVRDVNAVEGQAVKIEIEEYVYFDIAKGRVMRVESNQIQQVLVDVTSGGANGGGVSNNGGSRGGRPGPAQQGTGGGPAPQGGGMTPPPGDFFLNRIYKFEPKFSADGRLLTLFRIQDGAVGGGGSGTAGAGADGPPTGRGSGFGGNQQGGGGGPVTVKQILTIRSNSTIELEM